MRKIVFHLSIDGVVHHCEAIVVDDDASDSEIDHKLDLWTANFVETWWESSEEQP